MSRTYLEESIKDSADGRAGGPGLKMIAEKVSQGIQIEVYSPDGETFLGGAYVDYFDNKLRVIIDHPNSEVKTAEVLQKDVARACQRPQG